MIEKKIGTAPARVRDTHWYVYLHDSPRANEIVAEGLRAGPGSEDRLRRNMECEDGVKRDLWYVSHKESFSIRKAGHEFNFKVTVFVQSDNGRLRKWIDPHIARRKKALLGKLHPATE
jgi:hypothetical protein